MTSAFQSLTLSHEASTSSAGEGLARQFIEEATKPLQDQETSLEGVQTRLLLSIANYAIGDGRNSWYGLGTI